MPTSQWCGSMDFGIPSIVFVSSVIQVIWIAASSIAAFMEHHCFGFTIKKFEDGSMRALHFAETPISVSGSATTAQPFPAVLRVPKSHFATEILPRPCSLYDVRHRLSVVGGHASGTGIRWGTQILTSFRCAAA